MQELPLKYKAKNEDIFLLTGNLLHAPSKSILNNSHIHLKDKTLHVCFFDDISISSLDEAFQSSIKELSYYNFLKLNAPSRAFTVISTLLVLLIVLAMGIFSAYGNAAYDLLLEAFNPTDSILNKALVFISLLFSVLLLLYLFPVVIKGEIKDFITSISGSYFSKKYYKNRFEKYLNIYKKSLLVEKLVIWNPANKGFNDAVYWHTFIKACLHAENLQIYLCIHTDERYKTELIIDKIFKPIKYDLFNGDLSFLYWENQTEIPKEYLDKIELQLLELIVFCSTKNINLINDEIDITGYSNATEEAASLDFVEYLIHNFPERFPKLNEFINDTPLLVFFRRCVNDYGFLLDCYRSDLRIMCINSSSMLLHDLYENIHDELAFVYHYCHENCLKITNEVTDPVTSLIINILFLSESTYSKIKIKLIENFIFSAGKYEHYFLFYKYWPIIFSYENTDAHISPYILIDERAIIRLSVCFERAGLYESAYNAHDALITLYPLRSSVSQARIYERQGEYKKAINKLNSIFTDSLFGFEDIPFEEKIKYLLVYSWTVVSGRMESEFENGHACLEEAGRLIHSSYEISNTNDQIWHYHNNVAQYYEWKNNYISAIKEHEKCLTIPGVSQKWLSGTFVNLGISYRLVFLETMDFSKIEKSIDYGVMGVNIKNEAGDNDELPIALHNLALSTIFKYSLSKDKSDNINLIISSYDLSNKALEIYGEISSSKKMVMALFEFVFSSIILKKNKRHYDTLKLIDRGKDLSNSISRGFNDDANFESIKLLIESLFYINISSRIDVVDWVESNCCPKH